MKWIPVTERLPYDEESLKNAEELTLVIVTSEHGVHEAHFNKELGCFETDWTGVLENVTAWMPMPEPYKKPDRYDVITDYERNGARVYVVIDRVEKEEVFKTDSPDEVVGACKALNEVERRACSRGR